MSYILEALKKSDAERQNSAPEPQPTPPPLPTEAEPKPEPLPERKVEPELPSSIARTPLPVATTTSSGGNNVSWTIAGGLGVIAGLGAIYFMNAEPVVQSPEPPKTVEATPSIPKPSQAEKPIETPAPEPAKVVEETASVAPPPPPAPEPAQSQEPASPAAQAAEAAKPHPKEALVKTPELAVVDELPPEAKALIEKSRELSLAVPQTGNGDVAPRTSAKPVIITAPKVNSKAKTKAQKAKADALKSLRQINLAWGAIKRGQYTQAVRELDIAVKLVPNNADAWFARGWAHEKSGKELSAIGDYGRAIKAKPNHVFALFSRGYLNLYVGSPQDAITDFVRASGVAEERAFKLYTQLWLHLSRSRVAKGGAVEFGTDVEATDLNTWPGPLIRHIQGKIPENEVLSFIERGTDAQVREQRCTGFFFLGIQALESGNETKARSYFERALATGAVQFRQYDAAKRELERLKL